MRRTVALHVLGFVVVLGPAACGASSQGQSTQAPSSASLAVPWAYPGGVAALAVGCFAVTAYGTIRAARRSPLTVLREL